MNTPYCTKSKPGSELLRGDADGRRAELLETILGRLSSLESETYRMEHLTRQLRRSDIPDKTGKPSVVESDRFVLIGRSGPVAEFPTWGEATQYLATAQVEGGTILRVSRPRANPSRRP